MSNGSENDKEGGNGKTVAEINCGSGGDGWLEEAELKKENSEVL